MNEIDASTAAQPSDDVTKPVPAAHMHFDPSIDPIPDEEKQKKPIKPIVTSLVVVVVVALIVGWFVNRNLSMWRDDPNQPVPAGQATTPLAAVRGYLQAIAASNAKDAYSFSGLKAVPSQFLTDSMLAASNAIAPMTNIEVTKTPGSSNSSPSVDATYMLGDQTVHATYETRQYGKYYWVSNYSVWVNMPSASQFVQHGLRINDQNMPGLTTDPDFISVELFPGSYKMTMSNPLISLTGDVSFTLPDTSEQKTIDLHIGLVPNAQAIFAAATSASLKDCMTSNSIMTSCGIGTDKQLKDISTGFFIQPDSRTTKWSITKGDTDFTKAIFQWDPADLFNTTAPVNFTARVSFSANFPVGYKYSLDFTISKVTINFTNSDKLVVTFSS